MKCLMPNIKDSLLRLIREAVYFLFSREFTGGGGFLMLLAAEDPDTLPIVHLIIKEIDL